MKKRKKFNKNLAFIKTAKTIAKHYTIASIQGEETYNIVMRDKEVCNTISKEIESILLNIKFKWSLLLGAVCRDQSGKVYIKSIEISVKEECLTDNLDNILATYKGDFFATLNKLHFLTAFWAAKPVQDYTFSEEEISLIVDYKDITKQLITRYEHEQERV